MALQKARINRRRRFQGLWFERLMALLALTNLGLVLLDLSYIPWRDFYLKYLPGPTVWYGEHFKGIEPHRMTEHYLKTVQDLENQVILTGLESPEVNERLLNLQTLSVEIIDENPFEAVGKAGTLERIKNRMQNQVQIPSSKQAFRTFWSQDYLTRQGWDPSIRFFQREIQPLIARNYYRNIGENGRPINRFWTIDLWFMAIFAVEFCARVLFLSRRHPRTTWLDAVIWRCYDLLLLLPFWRWLRVIPVLIRLDQSRLVNFRPIYYRFVRTLIANVAIDLTEMVVMRILDQTQDLIRRGTLNRWLLQPRQYVDLNGVNEVEVIIQHLVHVLVYRVLPQIQPDVEALLGHSITQVLNQSPVYSGLQRLPGVSNAANQIAQQIVADLSNTTYAAICASLEDETGTALIKQLVGRLGDTFRTELQQNTDLGAMQSLSIALLEEIKVNYINQFASEDPENQRSQAQRMYALNHNSRLRD